MPADPASFTGPNPPSPQRLARLFKLLAAQYPYHPLENDAAQPFQVLVATILSARTKDPVTNAAMRRLWEHASGLPVPLSAAELAGHALTSANLPAKTQRWPDVSPAMLLAVPQKQLAQLLYPVGFYQTKARHLHEMCRMLIEDFGGQVPRTREELLRLPGVGRKVANLVLNICWDLPAICVDIHVHRICNRLGWVDTSSPEQTEQALMQLVPTRYWSTLNRVLVNHGQQVCQPLSPLCSQCSIYAQCPRLGVIHSR
ncbi:endonuclease III [bacterium]|nr:endonuclease III [bacterium]